MDKTERAKEIRKEVNAVLPSVDRFIELLQEIIEDKLYEAEGYTSFAKYVEAWPELQHTLQSFKGIASVRRIAVKALHDEGVSERQIAKTLGSKKPVANDLKDLGRLPRSRESVQSALEKNEQLLYEEYLLILKEVEAEAVEVPTA